MGTAGSGVDVLEQSVGMAKSGDDLMRWQSIARGERRSCRPRTYLVDQLNVLARWVSQRAMRLVNGE